MDPILDFLNNSYLWLSMAFVIFGILCYKKGKGAVVEGLDNKIDAIKTDLENAENLRIEAQELLAQYQRKYRDAQKEADTIIENAQTHADKIIKNSERELAEVIERKEKQLNERIQFMKMKAQEEVQEHAANLVINVSKEIISSNLDAAQQKKLVDASLKEVKQSIN